MVENGERAGPAYLNVAPATIAILGCLPKGTRSLDLSVEEVNLDLRMKCN